MRAWAFFEAVMGVKCLFHPQASTAPETLHCQSICDCIKRCDTVLIPNWAYLRHNGSIEAEAVRNHHVDLPLAVLLSDALIGREPRQGGLQCWQAVAGGQADVEQLTRLLRHTQAKRQRDTYEVQETEAFMCGRFVDNLPHHWDPLWTVRRWLSAEYMLYPALVKKVLSIKGSCVGTSWRTLNGSR